MNTTIVDNPLSIASLTLPFENRLWEGLSTDGSQSEQNSSRVDALHCSAADSIYSATEAIARSRSAPIPTTYAIATQVRERIERLAISREAWEGSIYARSNEILYGLIRDCFALYKELTEKSESAKNKRRGLDDYIALKGYSFKTGTPLTAKLIRCVFAGTDRRRLSTYHTVLRVAVAQNWDADEFAANVAKFGGVQEISLGKTSAAMTPKQKAEAAKDHVLAQSLAAVKSPELSKFASPDGIGAKVAAVLTQEADGSFTLHAIVHSDAAVNATLAAYFAAHKSDLNAATSQAAVTQSVKTRETLIDDAAQAVVNG